MLCRRRRRRGCSLAPTGVATRRLPHRSPYYVSKRFSAIDSYLMQALKPHLHKGVVIVLNNLGVHKASRTSGSQTNAANAARACCGCRPTAPTSTPSSRMVEAHGVAARPKRASAGNWRKPWPKPSNSSPHLTSGLVQALRLSGRSRMNGAIRFSLTDWRTRINLASLKSAQMTC